nr:hypothetical protein CFP56_60690 [Quercus suber]
MTCGSISPKLCSMLYDHMLRRHSLLVFRPLREQKRSSRLSNPNIERSNYSKAKHVLGICAATQDRGSQLSYLLLRLIDYASSSRKRYCTRTLELQS